MSRVGQAPIPVPSGVEVKIEGREVTVKGPKGELSAPLPEALSVTLEEGELTVARADDERESRALHGLFRSLIDNMVIGVTEGYRRGLEIVGVGYRATAQGDRALSWPSATATPSRSRPPRASPSRCRRNTRIDVVGIDKETVGQVAADIRAIRKPEPYKGKGIRYQGEVVRRKAGKAACAPVRNEELTWHTPPRRRPPATGATVASARRSRARPSGRAWPSSGRTGTSASRSSTTAPACTLAAASTYEKELRRLGQGQQGRRRQDRSDHRRAGQGRRRHRRGLRPRREPLPRARRRRGRCRP